MRFIPYLFFSGDCAAAFQHYQQILGGELQVMTHAELPEGAQQMPGAKPQDVMHASLTFDDGQLMGSDDPTGDDGPKTGFAVAYSASNLQVGKQVFDALAEGGTVDMPFGATDWSPGFGVCTDRFGMSWMVSSEGET